MVSTFPFTNLETRKSLKQSISPQYLQGIKQKNKNNLNALFKLRSRSQSLSVTCGSQTYTQLHE